MIGGILQETAAIIDDNMNAWVAVGVIRVVLSAKLLDRGVNLYRRDRIHTVRQGDRGIGAGSGPKNQRVVERPVAEYPVDLLVEWLLILPGSHRLVPYAVYIDDVAIRNGRTDDDFIVRRPVRADLELTHLYESGGQNDCREYHCAFRAEQQQEGAQDSEPGKRW